MIVWLRYVPLDSFLIWLARGWRIESDFVDAHHGRHAILMRFDGEVPP